MANVNPIDLFRDQAASLAAAILQCRATRKKEAVHKLRTATRRIEAHLNLLDHVPGLPPHANEAAKLRKHLRELRRAAGVVRDLDVQRGLIRDDLAAEDGPLQKQARALRKHLKHQRENAVASLRSTLHDEEQKLADSLTAFEKVLKNEKQVTLPATKATAIIERWFHDNTPALRSPTPPAPEDEEALHSLRKAAKLCRYMAEDLPASQRLAAHFESLQEAGGKWHDWLLLHQIAAKRAGKHAEITIRYAGHRDAALAAYQRRLSSLRPVKPARPNRAA
jgi:CHAD domain-containing protein